MVRNQVVMVVLGELIGLATTDRKGLMPAGGFISLGDLMGNNLNDIQNGYGYGYADYDGSEIYGPFLSIFTGASSLQIKASHLGDSIKFRTRRADGDNSWSAWKKILTE